MLFKQCFSLLLSISMLLTTAAPALASSELSPPGIERHYQLITPIIFAWKNSAGIWQNSIEPGKPFSAAAGSGVELVGDFDKKNVRNVCFYNGMPFDTQFDFNTPNFFWYSNAQYAFDKTSYLNNYYDYRTQGYTASSPVYDPATGKVSFSYSTGSLESPYGRSMRFDVKELLAVDLEAGADQVYARMGYTRETAPASIKKSMEELYPTSGQSSNVEGYLFFAPFIIQYDVVTGRPLLPPDALLDCGDSEVTAGDTVTLSGVVKHKNDFTVGVTYVLSVNGKTIKTGTSTIAAQKGIGVSSPYKIPSSAKPGSKVTVKLTGTIWDPENPDVKLSDFDTCIRYVVLSDSNFDGGLQPSEIVD